ncbi:DUF664 domain-containing protein [Aquimarina sp. ERC-38]|uniref:DinB family protein n=1 Tax=Aquimarina sp. ERC-38 TaxID=2949996 RepID=UPI0022484688|nr:DUF664 domain-containing protein [Aquimarina sp. ERC-38]UZO82180.1 DUF664 domain-containing protein [Aquimarina sp. ERC-38]
MFEQKLKLESDQTVDFKLIANIKTKGLQDNSAAFIWTTIKNKKGEEEGKYKQVMDSLTKSDTWSTYVLEGSFDQKAEELQFGGYVLGNGDFYFDDFKLIFREANSKDYNEVSVSNHSFQKPVVNDSIPEWSQFGWKNDSVLKVKGFSFHTPTSENSKKSFLHIKGRGVEKRKSGQIKAKEGFSPQIGVLIAMLNNLSNRVERVVKDLDLRETDHLHDEKANRIGALIMHLAAAEKIYQNMTFENRRFTKDEEIWQIALELDEKARHEFQGKPIKYYLDIYKETREKTIEELKKRDDTWLEASWPGSTMNNHFAWFHVMEHQSSHLGQILFLKKRIPEEKVPEPKLEEEID